MNGLESTKKELPKERYGQFCSYEFRYETVDEAIAAARQSIVRNGYEEKFIGKMIAKVEVDVPSLLPAHITPMCRRYPMATFYAATYDTYLTKYDSYDEALAYAKKKVEAKNNSSNYVVFQAITEIGSPKMPIQVTPLYYDHTVNDPKPKADIVLAPGARIVKKTTTTSKQQETRQK